MTKIYDSFLFFNELDLLELRMNILDPVVDYFVISEATVTFSGLKKPLNFKENADRFLKFKDKIIYSVVDDTPETFDHWDRDKFHRECVARGFKTAKDDDIILTSDLDEIPNPEVLKKALSFCKDNMLFIFEQNMYYYYLNMLKEEGWFGTRMCRKSYFNDKTVDLLRQNEYKQKGVKLKNGGWHFSFMGGTEMIKKKIESYGHQEFNNDFIKSNVESNIQQGKDIFFRNSTVKKVEIDQTYPNFILENLEKYKHLIKE